ncbi:bifunctional nuclease family protein [Bergeyella porcorum]|uniref:bifunctional nuclease family protein n=1 Tax=Bergeyella porcorum TaxID=1735111 RepID=UPI0035E82735
MDYKKLIIRGISYSQTQSGAYALLLEHEESKVKLPVVIGNFEAQSISLGLEKDLRPPRPLTHDLFSQFVTATGYRLESVIIYQIIDGVFFSNINFKNIETEEELTLDARTSDAVAMAVRFNAPIFTTSQVLNEAGILLELEMATNEDAAADEEETDGEDSLRNMTNEELQILLEQVVKEEDFDAAVEIQEEIKRRKKKID